MEKKDLDWSGLGFGYRQTDKRYVTNFKDGAWDNGVLTEDANIVLNECVGRHIRLVCLDYLPDGFHEASCGKRRHLKTHAAVMHALLIQIRAEHDGLSILCRVRLQPLKTSLCIL